MKKIWKTIQDSWFSLCFKIAWLNWTKILKVLLAIVLTLALVAALYFGFDQTYKTGFDRGRSAGQCEVACATFGVSYGQVTDEGDCWCKIADGNYWYLPLSEKFEKELDN